MRFLFTISILLLTILSSNAQRREFHPTIDIGLNGGVSFADYNTINGQLKIGGLSLMANTGFNRHIVEFDVGNSLSTGGWDYIRFSSFSNYLKPTTLNLNYTFARELYAYYPACMIRNQLLLGLRLNAELFMGNLSLENQNGLSYSTEDYGRYSADITLITDYHLNKSNYLVLQLYTPLLTYFANPFSLSDNEERPFELDDRLDVSKSWFFDEGELGWVNKHSKFGVNATYRLLLTETLGLQVKYNGKIRTLSKSKKSFSDLKLEENYHQITFGIVGHIVRPPVGF